MWSVAALIKRNCSSADQNWVFSGGCFHQTIHLRKVQVRIVSLAVVEQFMVASSPKHTQILALRTFVPAYCPSFMTVFIFRHTLLLSPVFIASVKGIFYYVSAAIHTWALGPWGFFLSSKLELEPRRCCARYNHFVFEICFFQFTPNRIRLLISKHVWVHFVVKKISVSFRTLKFYSSVLTEESYYFRLRDICFRLITTKIQKIWFSKIRQPLENVVEYQLDLYRFLKSKKTF